jgi:hypothetical protein
MLAGRDLRTNAPARDAIQRWTIAVGQYVTMIADGSDEDVTTARASLITVAAEIDAGINWNTVKGAADAAWLRRREHDL